MSDQAASGSAHHRRVANDDTAPGARARPVSRDGATPGEEEEPLKAPWHFKVLAVGTVGYLIYRFIWFIFWLTGHAWHG